MDMSAITLTTFTVFNMLRLGSYLPQILRIATDTDGAKAIAYSTWWVWTGANGSTAAYAVVNITDWTLFAVSSVNTIGCATIIAMTYWKRRRLALRTRAS